MHPELAELWYTPEGVGQFHFVHQVSCTVADAQQRFNMITRGTAEALKRVEVDLDRILQIQAEGENHQLRAYLKMVQEKMRANGDASFLPGVHFHLTSFDLQDTATSMMLYASAGILMSGLESLKVQLRRLATEHKFTLMIGRSHGIHGKPITFGKKCLDWLDQVDRAGQRLIYAARRTQVGKISGAMGIYAQDPRIERTVCNQLGLQVARVSTQIVARDYYAEYFGAVVLVMTALDQIATQIRLGQQTDRGELEEPFRSTGSSAMPHKRNPETCERATGLTRVVRNLMGVLYEDVVTWDERSLEQSSAERVTFGTMLVLCGYGINIMTNILAGLKVYPERMKQNLERTNGAIYAEDVKDALQEIGVDQNTAYMLVQGPAQRAYQGEGQFIDLVREEPEVAHRLTTVELWKLCNPEKCFAHLDEIYARFKL